ncbi:NADH-ubiquinone oxidoreductase assembly factor N7BML [Dichotomopilus funicola]|uniref:NADH-ubiquinone oxidoreductase assembly factor N7BML n=1 Tax=Dichotomopilus funicola TaxID=1934379 RepID=A0AAN6V2S4_9PEZI|nr:NADH-ubiquinone oxidoreductase assembly factor N7BML [Dichotomopilus funicola]
MSAPQPLNPLTRAWRQWKSLRLPWRRQFLAGQDLSGNTYWEFLDRGAPLPPSSSSPSSPPSPGTTPNIRWRRIVRYPSNKPHHDSVTVPPAWHQWLRHTRADPPSLDEQRAEVVRQARMKVLAAEADARWEAKPRVMEDVGGRRGGSEGSVLGVREPALDTEGGELAKRRVDAGELSGTGQGQEQGVKLGDNEIVNQREDTWKRMQKEESNKRKSAAAEKGPDPWKQQQARGAPGETWQPKAWDPAAKR